VNRLEDRRGARGRVGVPVWLVFGNPSLTLLCGSLYHKVPLTELATRQGGREDKEGLGVNANRSAQKIYVQGMIVIVESGMTEVWALFGRAIGFMRIPANQSSRVVVFLGCGHHPVVAIRNLPACLIRTGIVAQRLSSRFVYLGMR